MKLLVFDTETTGLPPRGAKLGVTPLKDFPHIVQLSYILYDTEKHSILISNDHIIRLSNEIELSEESISIHRVTRDVMINRGVTMKYALELFEICARAADVLVAHNLDFDKRMLFVEARRNGIYSLPLHPSSGKEMFCTMKTSVETCRIEAVNKRTGEKYFKYPTLSELHKHLFGILPTGVHNAFVDILVCLRCYVYIQDEQDVLLISKKFQKHFEKYMI
jgi:DNA polymerase III epsilon subunit-like protein